MIEKILKKLEIRKSDSYPNLPDPEYLYLVKFGFVSVFSGLVSILTLGRYVCGLEVKVSLDHALKKHKEKQQGQKSDVS